MSVALTSLAREHREELLASAISHELIDFLVSEGHLLTLDDDREIDRFLNRNTRSRWKHGPARRGWLFRGVDPLTWERMSWGCFKPDSPRLAIDKPGKVIKYEHPLGEAQRLFLVPAPNLDLKKAAKNPTIALALTEGFKKTASLCSAGYFAAGLSGIWGGTRRQADGSHELTPDLKALALPGREVTLIFDHDAKIKTVRQVQLAQIALGKALVKAGCKVRVAYLPGPEKGVDDFRVARGDAALAEVMQSAISFEEFLDTVWDSAIAELSCEPTQLLEQKYLDVELPDQGVVVIQSPMGTGKTELLRSVCAQAPSVLSLTHRITLGRQAANRLGLALYSDANIKQANRLEITVDSLYKLPTFQNRYHTVILDEVVQVISHMLDSSTCKEQRVAILQKFAYFVQSAERVILQQAEISDAVLQYICKLRGEVPHVIRNDYASEPRLVAWYQQHNPSVIIGDLQQAISGGERVLIPCYSKRRAKSLEVLLSKRFPEKKIRVIHGDNSSDPETIAFIESINQSVVDLDVLIFTPSMSTGVSIDTQSFTSVWGIFDTAESHGSELLQMLGRYRPTVPWFVWSATRGAGYVGSLDSSELMQREIESNRRTGILTQIDPTTGIEAGPHLECWAAIKAQFYSSKLRQREVLRKLLAREGHHLLDVEGGSRSDIVEALKAAKLEIQQTEAEAIASARDLTESEAEILSFKSDRLTEEERYQLEKHRLKQGYQQPVTPDLVLKDNSGRLLRSIIALEELMNPEIALERDLKDLEKFKFLPDRRHRTLKRAYRDKLGLKQFLDLDYEWSADDLDEFTEVIDQCRQDIKSVLNLTIPEKASPCWIVAQLLQQIGVKLVSRREGSRGSQVRVYQLDRAHWQFITETLDRRLLARERSTG